MQTPGRKLCCNELQAPNLLHLCHGRSAIYALLLVHIFGNRAADATIGQPHCVPHLSTLGEHLHCALCDWLVLMGTFACVRQHGLPW